MRNGRHKAIDPSFLVQLPNKLQNCLKLRKLVKDKEQATSVRKEEGSSATLRIDLERQLQSWRENPTWVDQPPDIKVSVPKGSLCNLNVKVNVGLPPAAVYDTVTDPDNRIVFKNIKMKFKQAKTGFIKKFEGCWRAELVFIDEGLCHPLKPKTWADYYSCPGGKGRIGSKLSLEQLIQPALVPPPPISWYLIGITSRTTEMIVNDLLAEAARIGGDFRNDKSSDIKERWAQHRRNIKKHHRRLLTAE
ncbi:hypothetical protein P3X46_017732 [Hevea brasiliensis]|uniref:DUF220 domain-containing protein n=1 Tax=Hevea brasiliensis TaxID=3981 RepID=A0ABQ9LSJ1_HEVBR|nr:hypothetical protein P3X46_017732 [Hevea brasiliensis]